jgi:hypothetical protein
METSSQEPPEAVTHFTCCSQGNFRPFSGQANRPRIGTDLPHKSPRPSGGKKTQPNKNQESVNFMK